MASLSTDHPTDLAFAREAAEQRVGLPSDFTARLEAHFPVLHGLFRRIYADRGDSREQLAQVIALAAESYARRPDDLKALDADRAADPK